MCPAFCRRHEGDVCRENDTHSRDTGRVRSTTGRLNVDTKLGTWRVIPAVVASAAAEAAHYGTLFGRCPEMNPFSARDAFSASQSRSFILRRSISAIRGPGAIGDLACARDNLEFLGNYDARFDSRAEHPRHAWISWTRGE